ncbi:hypothetical protein EXIGLDRAFT_735608, partial [Exidia glandulosa HHB12029]
MQTGKGAAHFRIDAEEAHKQVELCPSAFPHGTDVTFGPRTDTDAVLPQVVKREA